MPLETYGSYVLANVWYSDTILQIDPGTGRVVKTYDFSSLYPKGERERGADCFNGIAVVEGEEGVLLVTGKLWPFMYFVRLL